MQNHYYNCCIIYILKYNEKKYWLIKCFSLNGMFYIKFCTEYSLPLRKEKGKNTANGIIILIFVVLI